jgi:hypothetical protein
LIHLLKILIELTAEVLQGIQYRQGNAAPQSAQRTKVHCFKQIIKEFKIYFGSGFCRISEKFIASLRPYSAWKAFTARLL